MRPMHPSSTRCSGTSAASGSAHCARTCAAARHLVAPLSREEAAQLLDELLADREGADTALRDRVLERAGGVPFFLVSCAQGLHQERGDAGQNTVPWDIVQSIRQRVAALPEGAGEVLGVAA